MTTALLNDYLTREELAAEFRVSIRTINRWRDQVNGLPFVPIGKRTMYRKTAVAAWLTSRERQLNRRKVAA